MGTRYNPSIPKVGHLECHFDPADNISYPAGGTVMYDLSGRNNNHNLTNWSVVSGSEMIQSGSNVPIFRTTLDDDGDGQGTSVADASNANFVVGSKNASFSFWFRKVADSDNSNDLYSADRDDANGVRITVDNSGGVSFNTNSQGNNLATGNVISDDTWYNIVCTMDDKRKEVYLNGVLNVSTGSATTAGHAGPTISYNRNENFGTLHGVNKGYSLKGNFGPITVWNVRLSPDEVKQNFNAHRGRFGI
mgnify:CR=1 FL=1|tara:strand:- start:36 stop:779 length:744 start_codon:yes stop_codon:yes gene_type:complete